MHKKVRRHIGVCNTPGCPLGQLVQYKVAPRSTLWQRSKPDPFTRFRLKKTPFVQETPNQLPPHSRSFLKPSCVKGPLVTIKCRRQILPQTQTVQQDFLQTPGLRSRPRPPRVRCNSMISTSRRPSRDDRFPGHTRARSIQTDVGRLPDCQELKAPQRKSSKTRSCKYWR